MIWKSVRYNKHFTKHVKGIAVERICSGRWFEPGRAE